MDAFPDGCTSVTSRWYLLPEYGRQMMSPVVKHVYLRNVYSNTARGLLISRKSQDWARNLTKVAVDNDTFFTLTKLFSSMHKFCIIQKGM